MKVNSERRHRHMMVGIEGCWRALASTARQLGPTGEIGVEEKYNVSHILK